MAWSAGSLGPGQRPNFGFRSLYGWPDVGLRFAPDRWVSVAHWRIGSCAPADEAPLGFGGGMVRRKSKPGQRRQSGDRRCYGWPDGGAPVVGRAMGVATTLDRRKLGSCGRMVHGCRVGCGSQDVGSDDRVKGGWTRGLWIIGSLGSGSRALAGQRPGIGEPEVGVPQAVIEWVSLAQWPAGGVGSGQRASIEY
jgi:hypothetical protein